MILVTGGAGFIGSNFVLDWLKDSDEPILNLDALTYAGNLQNLQSLDQDKHHILLKGIFVTGPWWRNYCLNIVRGQSFTLQQKVMLTDPFSDQISFFKPM